MFRVAVGGRNGADLPLGDTLIQLGQKTPDGAEFVQNFALPTKDYLSKHQPDVIRHDVLWSLEQQTELTLNIFSSSQELTAAQVKALLSEAEDKFRADSKATATEVLSTQNSSFFDRSDSVKFKRTSKTHNNISTKTISPTKF